ncbi:MAG: hypothetical protein LIP01_06010 [Tannerellaceae bacterium]|nr:hypothetical protein [Tannerellaceae bacterium]
MKNLTTYRITVLLLFFLLCIPFIQSTTKDWQLGPVQTFVFDLSTEQVDQLFRYQNENDYLAKIMTQPRPIASFSDEWKERPEQGHFVYAKIHRNEVTLHYTPAIPFQVFLISEYGRLTLQVIDVEGNLRHDATVRIKNYQLVEKDKPYKDYNDTPVPYDKLSQTYHVEESSRNRNRILTVELDGFTAFLKLYKNIPYRYSSSGGWGNSIPSFYSYLVTDKNKYKPGETVRFKSYALSGSRNPMHEPLNVWLSETYSQGNIISKIKPNHPGNYTGEIELTDSLDITLDKNYYIQLKDKKGKIVASTWFRYEEYELFDNKLQVKLQSPIQYHPENNVLEIHAIDANGLTLPDAHAETCITARNIKSVYEDCYILPDTILRESLQLDNEGPTQLPVPAYWFGKANLEYQIEITVSTPDHQPLSNTLPITFYYSHNEIKATLEGNQVKFELLKKGKPEACDAWIHFDYDKSTRKKSDYPIQNPLNSSGKDIQYIFWISIFLKAFPPIHW